MGSGRADNDSSRIHFFYFHTYMGWFWTTPLNPAWTLGRRSAKTSGFAAELFDVRSLRNKRDSTVRRIGAFGCVPANIFPSSTSKHIALWIHKLVELLKKKKNDKIAEVQGFRNLGGVETVPLLNLFAFFRRSENSAASVIRVHVFLYLFLYQLLHLYRHL